MKKIIKLISLNLIILILLNSTVWAESINFKTKEIMDTIMSDLRTGNTEIYNYIDTTNTELYENVKKFLGNTTIVYTVKNVDEDENSSQITAEINASGEKWTVSGCTAKFNFTRKNGEYILTDTTLFDIIGVDNIIKATIRILMMLAAIFIIVPLAIVIIIIVAIKKSKKRI